MASPILDESWQHGQELVTNNKVYWLNGVVKYKFIRTYSSVEVT